MAALSAGLMGRRDALSILNQAAPFSGLTQTQLLGGVAPAVEGSIMLGGSNALIVLGLPFALLGAYTWQASLMCVFDTNAYL
jgi:hypothetical protein